MATDLSDQSKPFKRRPCLRSKSTFNSPKAVLRRVEEQKGLIGRARGMKEDDLRGGKEGPDSFYTCDWPTQP